MSNEWKDYQKDLRDIFDAEMSEIDIIYDGWAKTFVPTMKDEMFNALGPYVEYFEILQIKEKYGLLEVYYGWKDNYYTNEELDDIKYIDDQLNDIIAKYRNISQFTCVICGEYPVISEYHGLTMCWDCKKYMERRD